MYISGSLKIHYLFILLSVPNAEQIVKATLS